ncbi:condensation domain-containing protein [Nocardia amamiensis]|uniref:condensation domain-containing protein n=1 Tax=Nocardia amamiensis TaxID=404578 RepID=UPI001FE0F63C|nr:condensation domain-containing protein [Nocardia amamiensis]
MASLEDLQAAMRARLSDVGIAAAAGVATRRDRGRAPLSFAQRTVWAYQRQTPESTAHNLCLAFTFTGEVDGPALRRAFLALVRRHEVLRTTYHADPDGTPYQRIHKDLPPRVESLDLRDEPAAGARLRAVMAAAGTESFDLAAESSLRLTFVKLPPDDSGQPKTAVVMALQHIAWDGMTLPVLSRDLERAYVRAKERPGSELDFAPLSLQVADFAEWEQNRFVETDHADDIRFWERQFGGLEPLRLPYDRQPDIVSERGGRSDRTLSTAADKNLRALSTTLRTPAFSVFLAAYYLTLHRITGQRDILIGTAVANREEFGMESLIGNFSNSIALRIGADDASFADLVAHVRAVTDAAFGHRNFPYDRIAEAARQVGGPARPYESLVLFLEQKIDGPQLPGCTTTWELAEKGYALLPLTVEAFLHADHTDVQIAYQIDLFDEQTVTRIHEELDRVLATADGQDRELEQ